MMLVQRVAQNTSSFFLRLIVCETAHICREAPEKFLADIGMKLALKVRPVRLLATDHQRLKLFPLSRILQELGNAAKVPAHFIFRVTLRMPAIVPSIAIAAAMSRQRVGHTTLVFQLFELHFQKARRLPVQQ